MGRLEAFAMANGPWESCFDGVGNGLGYANILVIVAFFRELLGRVPYLVSTAELRCNQEPRICKQRFDDDATYGIDYRGMYNLVSAC